MKKTAALALAAALSALWCTNAFAKSVLAQLPTVSCMGDVTYNQSEMLKIVNDSARAHGRRASVLLPEQQPADRISDVHTSLHTLLKH